MLWDTTLDGPLVTRCSKHYTNGRNGLETQLNLIAISMFVLFVYLELNVALTVFQSYRDVQLITSGGRPRGTSVHYFRHRVHPGRTTDLLQASWKASSLENPKCPDRDLHPQQ